MLFKLRKLEDLEYIDTNTLTEEKVFDLIQPMVSNVYEAYNVDDITRTIGIFDKVIKKIDQEKGKEWQLRNHYLKLSDLLKFGLLFKLSEKEVNELIGHSLVYILTAEPDLVKRFQYAVFLWGDYDRARRESMLNTLLENDEKIGDMAIKDWLRDYESNIIPEQRGAFSLANYLIHSRLVGENKLNKDDKEILRRILKLYDWLKSGGPLPGEMVFSELRNRKAIITSERASVKESEEVVSGESNANHVHNMETTEVKTEEITPLAVKGTASGFPVLVKSESPQINNNLFIHSAPQTFKSVKPALVFDMEDEKEVDKHRSKNTEEVVVFEKQLRTFVSEVIKEKNLAFKDEVNQRRFVQLMVSRLKDVRGPLEVAEALRKAIEAGGLGMPDEKADQVQRIVEEAKKEFEEKIKNQKLKIKDEEIEISQPSKSVVTPIKPAKPAFDAEASRIWREQMLREIQAQGKSGPDATGQASSPQLAIPRPQLIDVKAPPKVVGPLEELRSLTLVDFRRLGATPQEALQKIGGKIDLLGETSIGRKLEAVKAWKSSVVYQQYLRLGRESIEQGKPVSVIAGSHQTLGEPVLSEDEFTSIADFNAKLRF